MPLCYAGYGSLTIVDILSEIFQSNCALGSKKRSRGETWRVLAYLLGKCFNPRISVEGFSVFWEGAGTLTSLGHTETELRWKGWATPRAHPVNCRSLLRPVAKMLGRGRLRCIQKRQKCQLALLESLNSRSWLVLLWKTSCGSIGPLLGVLGFLLLFWVFYSLLLRGLWLLHPCWGLSHGFLLIFNFWTVPRMYLYMN